MKGDGFLEKMKEARLRVAKGHGRRLEMKIPILALIGLARAE
jgi:hypothetical protein